MLKVLSHMVLSVLLVFSATGMTINMHFCQGQLYDVAFNTPAADCCEYDLNDTDCHHNHDMAKPHHCDDESIKVESSHEYLVSGFSFNFENSHSFALFSTSPLILDLPDTEGSFINWIFDYNKPPPQEVVLSQIQSFLI